MHGLSFALKWWGINRTWRTKSATKSWSHTSATRPLPHCLWRVTWTQCYRCAPDVIMYMRNAWFCHAWRARHRGKNKAIQSYEDEHLESWPVYVRRCGPADWLVSEQRPPSHKQDLSCTQSTNEHANPQWCHWQVQVCMQYFSKTNF